jgi:hypothetical protein
MKHIFSALGPAQENLYFRQKEAELLNHLRREAGLAAGLQRIGGAAGAADQDLLHGLLDLGYTSDTVVLLPLVPLVQIAWANREVSSRESERIRELAHTRGIDEGSPAFDLLESWLSRGFSDEFFRKTLRVIGRLLNALRPDERNAVKQEFISSCSYVAQGSGAILGLGNAIGFPERKLLEEIAGTFEQESKKSADEIARRM